MELGIWAFVVVAAVCFGAVIAAGNLLQTPLAAIAAALALAGSLAALIAPTRP